MVSLALFAGAWLAAAQSTSRCQLRSFGVDSESTRSARGLAPSVAKDAGSGLQWAALTNIAFMQAQAERFTRGATQAATARCTGGVRCASRSGSNDFVVESQGVVQKSEDSGGQTIFDLAARFQ